MRTFSVLLVALAFGLSAAALAKEEPKRASAHAAIAYHPESGSVGWATDRKTSREAKLEALRQCSHERCEVVGEASRGCMALARGGKKHVVQQGVTRQEAEAKALRRCGDRCEIAAWTCTR
ncbi:MAG TPA: DUF4189 domain-containing protein [Burkholderiales bacterium]|nr:DUF4189 domain-containing protein [Burkholderiales bacterium]